VHKLWLWFAQAVTVFVAALFVVSTFHPEWLPQRPPAPAAPEPRPPGPAPSLAQDSYREAVRRAMPAVVNIYTTKEVRAPRHPLFNDPLFRRFFGEPPGEGTRRATSLGSGVIVSASGDILTNHHVIEGADEIEVALADGKRLQAKVVGTDPETDLAVLRVPSQGLPVIAFGSSDALRVGDVVLAIGNALGLGHTVTAGIVSALGRSGLGINIYENYIQTDAAINQGNSGGALVDAQGQLVGINNAILSQTGGSIGIGFAIPVSTAKAVLDQIVSTGSVTRGWIGVELQELTPALAESFGLEGRSGAVIASVLPGGPADRAGVRPGDVLLAIDGRAVSGPPAVLNLVAGLAPGASATLRLWRKGAMREVAVTVGRRPRPPRAD